MALYQYKSYGNTRNPENLIIFIHGYKSSMDKIADEAAQLAHLTEQSIVITPQSNKTRQNSDIYYWYNVSDYDTEHKRRNPDTPLNEIVDIYNSAGLQLAEQAEEMNAFVSEMQKLYNVNNQHTYIAGFSQGAMMAIFTALSRKETIGGCFSLSGIIAGKDQLEKELSSKPKVYMLHGENDSTVQYKTLDFSVNWLQQHQIDVEAIRYKNMAHSITAAELNFMAQIINKTLAEKNA